MKLPDWLQSTNKNDVRQITHAVFTIMLGNLKLSAQPNLKMPLAHSTHAFNVATQKSGTISNVSG